jgi:PIN domain nuclease of toxin-antitoxin system
MNLLLDTHVFIWWDEGRKFSPRALRAIESAGEVFVSSASAWEIAIKAGLGRFRTTRRLREAVPEAGFSELPVTIAHAERVRDLPLHHRDPFDRLLIAQALEERLVVMTRDPVFRAYPIRVMEA